MCVLNFWKLLENDLNFHEFSVIGVMDYDDDHDDDDDIYRNETSYIISLILPLILL